MNETEANELLDISKYSGWVRRFRLLTQLRPWKFTFAPFSFVSGWNMSEIKKFIVHDMLSSFRTNTIFSLQQRRLTIGAPTLNSTRVS